MCSWCWGFSPVVEDILKTYQGQITFQILVGGLRPGNTERFDSHKREYILGHWQAVYERTGQPFDFTFQMEPDFTYDTEPASRALVAMRKFHSQAALPFLKDIQQAFYVHNKDVTNVEVLMELASRQNLNQKAFLDLFRSAELKKQVWEEFAYCRELGVTGFPTLLGQNDGGYVALSRGYQSFDALSPLIDGWLEKKTD